MTTWRAHVVDDLPAGTPVLVELTPDGGTVHVYLSRASNLDAIVASLARCLTASELTPGAQR